MKKRLTQAQEFDIMKLVLDKFLWVGLIICGFGFWKLYTGALTEGLWIILAGAVVFVLFMILIIKEYEFIR